MPVINYERVTALTPDKWEWAKIQIPELAEVAIRALEVGDRVSTDLENENHRHGAMGTVIWRAWLARETAIQRALDAVDRQIGLLATKRDLKVKVLEATETKLRRLRDSGLYPARQDRLEERAGDLEGQVMELDAEIERLLASGLESQVEATPCPVLLRYTRDGLLGSGHFDSEGEALQWAQDNGATVTYMVSDR